jgi:autotransporter family porin
MVRLIAACILASLSLGISEPALAQCTAVGGSTTCTSGGNPYSAGINVDGTGTPSLPLSLTLQPGVQVVIPAGGIGNAVNAANTTNSTTPPSAAVTINTDGVTINNTANPSGNNLSGLRIQSSGAATITATNTNIDVNGVAGSGTNDGIWAIVQGSNAGSPVDATVTWTGDHITSSGQSNSTGIQAENRGSGNASVDASGNISVSAGTSGGFNNIGIKAGADSTLGGGTGGPGDASVIYRSGTINLVGAGFSDGIFATAPGSATVTTLSGTTIIVSSMSSAPTGVEAFSDNAAATATVASTIAINGNPATPTTNYKSNPAGIRAQSDTSGDASVIYTGPGITVHGGGGLGIVALTGSPGGSSASGSVTVDASLATGSIVADGSNAVGIVADSGFIRNVFSSGGRTPTTTTGSVAVTASNVSALGQFGTAISATGGNGGVTVTVPSGGSIMGGWQADVTSVGSVYGLKATGVVLGSAGGGIATLTNNGSIGALSDRAVASPLSSFFANPVSPFPTSNNTSVINNGTITGFVQLVGSGNSIVNNGTFDLRHFADTTGAVDASGNGVRDTLRVAVTDLGPGTFTNNGTLALLGGPGATRLDPGGQYLPLGLTFNSMALNGPVQGQIFGATTFTNSGTIDLQANPVPGDVLVITGRQALVPTPLVAGPGPGTFISNGGTLKLDTVLNQGGTASQSDVLVVDGTSVGGGGATQLVIRNAGGTGLQTVGDGILVVQVLDPNRSDAGAFVRATGELRAGAFDYDLFHGGVGGSNPSRLVPAQRLHHSPVRPDTAHPDAAHSDAAHSDAAHSDAAYSDATHSDTADPDTARDGAARAVAARADPAS